MQVGGFPTQGGLSKEGVISRGLNSDDNRKKGTLFRGKVALTLIFAGIFRSS